jgi:hypothetical protein
MFLLYTATYRDLEELFGGPEDFMYGPSSEKTFLNREDFEIIPIGQDQRPVEENTNAILFLAKLGHEKFQLHTTIPDGYTFIYRQEWGLSITPEILHRVISNLRKESYPPMEDYLDAKVKNDTAQENDYIAKCLAIKQKYPKLTFI